MTNRLTAIDIELRVAAYFGYRQSIVVPNISWGIGLHECDLLIVRKSGYGIEVEIKVSKSDLKADAKKLHQHIDRQNRLSELYFAIPDYLKDCIEYIPERAGILILSRSDWGLEISTARKATINKNRRKFTSDEMLKIAHLGTMRIWNLKRQLINYKRKRNKKQHMLIEENQLSLAI